MTVEGRSLDQVSPAAAVIAFPAAVGGTVFRKGDRMARSTDDLLRFLADQDQEHGVPLTEIPERLLDAKLLTTLDGSVEIGYSETGLSSSRGKYVEVVRWFWRSPAAPGYAPLRTHLPEIVSAGWHIRLTVTGQVEAARTSTPKRKRRRSSPQELTEIQRKTVEVVGDCKGNISKAARRLRKDRKTVAEAYKTAFRKLGKEPIKYGIKTFVRDRRGQDDVSDIDDQRRDVDEDQQRRYRRR